MIGAIEKYFPTAYRQRCVKNKVDNVMDSIPKGKAETSRGNVRDLLFGEVPLIPLPELLAKAVRWALTGS